MERRVAIEWETATQPPEEVAELLRDIGRLLKAQMPTGYGFTLLIFDFGDSGSMNYISSARRPDMVKAMRELCDRIDR